MQFPSNKILRTPVTSLVFREFYLFLQFSWRDWSATIIPASLFAPGAMKGLAYDTAAYKYLIMVLWVTSYIYAFNLYTQVNSLDEDRTNKPDRPLPSGAVTEAGTWIRCAVLWSLFFAIGIKVPAIIPETISHAVMAYFLTATKLGNTWLGKNTVAMTVMTWSLLSAARKLISPVTPRSSDHVIGVALWAGLVSQTQDFRDQKGDLITRRQTLPLAFGDSLAGYMVAFFFMPLAYIIIYWHNIGIYAPWMLGALHASVSYRILVFREIKADHQTYMLVTYMFCLTVAISSVVELGFVLDDVPMEVTLLRLLGNLVRGDAIVLRHSSYR
ncbi:hypothetical protein NM208_g4958 [Fusarium decemcellulare]|uniref:Uncharacterized protein n=1 Tax=Fusarium decemcellulare TaxID=57161 RepID=A0ACC1SIQ5_9HYPO|nr:hypothetical protein NM208_g4958 [Fusarium decemcellulare]